GDAAVDLFELAADIVDEQFSGTGTDGKRKWITQTKRPNCLIFARRLTEQRVVVWNRAVAINTQDLALKCIKMLSRRFGRLLVDADRQLPLAAAMQRSSLMTGRPFAPQLPPVVANQQDFLAAGDRVISHQGEPADAVMRIRFPRDVADVEKRNPRKIK